MNREKRAITQNRTLHTQVKYRPIGVCVYQMVAKTQRVTKPKTPQVQGKKS